MTGIGETLIIAAAAGIGGAAGKWVTRGRLRRLVAPLWRKVREHDQRIAVLETVVLHPQAHAR